MNRRKNVLVFPAGSEIAHEIYDALKFSKFVSLFGGTSEDNHAKYWFKNIIDDFPSIYEEGFIDYLNRAIDEHHIDYVYPALDSVCLFLSQNMSKINAKVVIADYKTTSLCRSKSDTYKFFNDESFIPRVYENIEDVRDFPVFIKPKMGEGAKGAVIIGDKKDLTHYYNENVVVCEYLPGDEYTVDCYTNKDGKLLSLKMRSRERIKAGIAVRSNHVEINDEVIHIAETINSRLDFFGAWFFQVKRDNNNKLKLLEISPRIPGTMGISRNKGINYPLLTIMEMEGYDVEIQENNYTIQIDRCFKSEFMLDLVYENVYVDYDDTLIIDGKVNNYLMFFLYQCVNEGKKIFLLSKHIGDIFEDLAKYRIDKNIFDEIYVLNREDEKIEYIKGDKCIFIDDSFAERKKFISKGIPAFDLDMIESLVDWRR